jgi:hypothetical protein
MSGLSTITRRHLDRLAMIYIRQSTITQVREHTESTARQYALTETAQRLGWDASQIFTIDADLGLSAGRCSGVLFCPSPVVLLGRNCGCHPN